MLHGHVPPSSSHDKKLYAGRETVLLLLRSTLCGQSNSCLVHNSQGCTPPQAHAAHHSEPCSSNTSSGQMLSNCNVFKVSLYLCSSLPGCSPCLLLPVDWKQLTGTHNALWRRWVSAVGCYNCFQY